MNRYRIHATVTRTFLAEEDVSFEITAESEEEARTKARDDAREWDNIRARDAELEETSVYLSQVDLIEGDEQGQEKITPRCEKTPDMFMEAPGNAP